jgi:hypothetical protein
MIELGFKMRMHSLFTFIFCGIYSSSYAQQNAVPPNSAVVAIHTDQSLHKIHPDFWGTNLLFWVDDDADLADGQVISGLKDVNMKLLRFPGGTVADNFHWKTNKLENINMFPFEDGEAQTDFDEFMKICKQVGAEPACVLNTESWAVKKDVAGGAHEAAEWLRYCKSKGYKVKYWEIGNETYWHPVMTASDYADLINVYADSLRRVDPNIILGINGHWSVDFVGTAERIKTEAYPQLMAYRNDIKNKADYTRYNKFLEENTIKPITKGEVKWWQVLVEKCGKNIDMIIVHWYFGENQLSSVSKRLSEVKNMFETKYPDKRYLMNISEYNVTERSAHSHMHLTQMIGEMLAGKVDLSNLWPMRMKYKKPTLFEWQTNKRSILFEIHKKLSENLNGNLVKTSSTEIPAFASVEKNSMTTVLTAGKEDKARQVTIRTDGRQKFNTCTVWKIAGTEFDYQVKQVLVPVKNGIVTLDLQPLEVVVAVFK